MIIADSSRGATPTSLGIEGGGLGFSGIPGLAVALDEFKNTVNPSNNFVGLTDGPTSSSTPELLHWLATANLAVPLQNATHHVKVVTASTTSPCSSTATSAQPDGHAPASAYLGFSAGTGGVNNRHAIAKLVVGGATPPPSTLRVRGCECAAGVAAGCYEAGCEWFVSVGFHDGCVGERRIVLAGVDGCGGGRVVFGV